MSGSSTQRKGIAVMDRNKDGSTSSSSGPGSDDLSDLEKRRAYNIRISTTLYEACRQGDLELAQRLIEKGADENEIKLAFHIACTNGHLDIAHILVTVGGADVNLFNDVSIWLLQKIYLTYLFYIVFFAVISTRLYSMEIRLFWLRVS